MAMTFHLDVVSAEQQLFSGRVEAVFAPTELGEIGVLPLHSPLIAKMLPGELRFRPLQASEDQLLYVSGGMIEVQPHVVTVLSDTAIRAHDLDEAKVLKAREDAQAMLANAKSEFDFSRAQSELAETMAQLRTIQKLREQAKR
jgi:F-type H+-transporting ATPase subunit epsilon